MKRTILMLAMVGVALAACEKKDEPYQFKTGEYVYLNGVDQPKFKSTFTQYSVYEIVRTPTVCMQYTNEGDNGGRFTRGFWDELRDTANNRLLMMSDDVITSDGRLLYEFIGAVDIVLRISEEGDTCGYIPQSVIDNAREQIESLYAQERYDEIYELFHTAFTFYTCTGQEYKDIVANGGN